LEWLGGIGLGRLPARYDRDVPYGETPGRAVWQGTAAGGHARIEGPRSREELAGRHGLTQRVAPHNRYTIRLDWRSDNATRLLVRVCESHLLYVRACQWTTLRSPGGDGLAWRSVEAPMRGPRLSAGPIAWAPRQTVLTLSVLDAGASMDLDNVQLRGANAEPLLDNGDFARGFAHWLPAAQSYFVPWHIDNLYLELLIERGIVGAGVVLALVAVALRSAVTTAGADDEVAPFLSATVASMLTLGLLSSVQDVPRVALLFSLVVLLMLARKATAH
jgi:hypothetical protein